MVVWKEIQHEDDDPRVGEDDASMYRERNTNVFPCLEYEVSCETARVHIEDVES